MTDLMRRRQRATLLLVMLAPMGCAADVTGAVNSVRTRGCDARPGGTAPLRASAPLDEVARQLAAGAPLGVALQRANYHAVSSFSVSVAGVPPNGDVARILAQQFCQQSTNPAFREIGVARRGADVWIAFAEPFSPPARREAAAISRRVLQLTNAARAQPRRCGLKAYAAAPPLTLNATLGRAALAYAQELASHGVYGSHRARRQLTGATHNAQRLPVARDRREPGQRHHDARGSGRGVPALRARRRALQTHYSAPDPDSGVGTPGRGELKRLAGNLEQGGARGKHRQHRSHRGRAAHRLPEGLSQRVHAGRRACAHRAQAPSTSFSTARSRKRPPIGAWARCTTPRSSASCWRRARPPMRCSRKRKRTWPRRARRWCSSPRPRASSRRWPTSRSSMRLRTPTWRRRNRPWPARRPSSRPRTW